MITKSNTFIDTHLQSIVQNSIQSVVKTNGTSDQEATILVGDCYNSNVSIDQNALLNLLAKSISSNLVNDAINNKVADEIQKKIENDVSQTNAGLNIGILILIIILVVVGGGAITFLKSPAGKIVAVVVVLGLLGFGGYWVYSKFIKKPSK